MTAAEQMLLEVYQELGPKEIVNSKCRSVPPDVFASMTRKDVDRWDGLYNRFLFQRVAKVLAKCKAK